MGHRRRARGGAHTRPEPEHAARAAAQAGSSQEFLMTPFDLVEPPSLREAAALLDTGEPSVRAIAGGTAIMLMMKLGVLRPRAARQPARSRAAIFPHRNGCGRRAAYRRDGDVVGAGALSAQCRAVAPVITRTLRTLSNVRVRNVATLGGHLAHADPHMDLPPVLIALGASVSGVDATGGRQLPLEELYTGYLETVLARDELIAEVIVPCHECAARRLSQVHGALGGRLAGARRGGRARYRRSARARRAHRGERRDRPTDAPRGRRANARGRAA